MKKKLPIGISDFKKVITDDFYYVDKTLLIKEIEELSGQVMLIPRPRCWGKTLNLSMLKYFYGQSKDSNEHLFVNTKIWHEQKLRAKLGQYPVIFISFKDIKDKTFDVAYKKMTNVIAAEFKSHYSELSNYLSGLDAEKYQRIMSGTADRTEFDSSLFFLSELLYKHYDKHVMVLIDEYDAPIHTAFVNGYYEDVVTFIRSLFSAVLKDNIYLERSFLTGILRTAKEGIFSGLNNLVIATIQHNFFKDKFGFTDSDVKQLLSYYELTAELNDVKDWFDGYSSGDEKIYNPWSLLMCMFEQGALKPFWSNTSDNAIIKKIIVGSDERIKADFEGLLEGISLRKQIDEAFVFPGIEHNEIAIWSLLLYSGYLTYNNMELIKGSIYCDLSIPNEEVKILFNNFMKEIFTASLSDRKIRELFSAMTEGDAITFGEILQEFVNSSMSYYDIPAKEPEQSYDLFVLGLFVILASQYKVKSNRESGYGRYDIMLIPIDKNEPGIIIEFKKVSHARGENLEIASLNALEQISKKGYVHELKDLGVNNIIEYAVAFDGKQLLVKAS